MKTPLLLTTLLAVLATVAVRAQPAGDGSFSGPFGVDLPLTNAFEQDIFLRGEIASESDKAFADFLARANPHAGSTVWMNSPGGDPVAGMKIGAMIRERNLSTGVGRWGGKGKFDLPTVAPGECDSACSLAFLGGLKRIVPEGSRYGVHNVNIGDKTFVGAFELGQNTAAALTTYFQQMGVDASLIGFISRYDSRKNQTHYMMSAELQHFEVVTDTLRTEWAVTSAFNDLSLVGLIKDSHGGNDEVGFHCELQHRWSLSLTFVNPFGQPQNPKSLEGKDYIDRVEISAPSVPGKVMTIPGERTGQYLDMGTDRTISIGGDPALLDLFTTSPWVRLGLVIHGSKSEFDAAVDSEGPTIASFVASCQRQQ